MKKWLIIVIIIVILIAGVFTYSQCMHPQGQEPGKPIGGVYNGKVIAQGQSPDGKTVIYFEGKAPLSVLGWYQLQVGATYTIECKEDGKGNLTVKNIILVGK